MAEVLLILVVLLGFGIPAVTSKNKATNVVGYIALGIALFISIAIFSENSNTNRPVYHPVAYQYPYQKR